MHLSSWGAAHRRHFEFRNHVLREMAADLNRWEELVTSDQLSVISDPGRLSE